MTTNYLDVVHKMVDADSARAKQAATDDAAKRAVLRKEAEAAAGPCLTASRQVLSSCLRQGGAYRDGECGIHYSLRHTDNSCAPWKFNVSAYRSVALNYNFETKRLIVTEEESGVVQELAAGSVDDVLPTWLHRLAEYVKYTERKFGLRRK